MAYQTGTATSWSDLKSTIETFAQANGWTKTGSVLYKGSAYFAIGTDTNEINVDGGTGESGGSLTGSTGEPPRMLDSGYVGVTFPIDYYLFAHSTPDDIICVINHDASWFQWLAFGTASVLGAVTGGQWFGCSHASAGTSEFIAFTNTDGYTWVTGSPTTRKQPSFAPWWRTDDQVSAFTRGNCIIYTDLETTGWKSNSDQETYPVFSAPQMDPIIKLAKSDWNEQTILIPPLLFQRRVSGFQCPVAWCPSFRFCRIDNYAAGDIVTIGSDEWKVFPFLKKDLDDPTSPWSESTGPHGWAIAYDGP